MTVSPFLKLKNQMFKGNHKVSWTGSTLRHWWDVVTGLYHLAYSVAYANQDLYEMCLVGILFFVLQNKLE